MTRSPATIEYRPHLKCNKKVNILTLKVSITTKVVCFTRLQKYRRSLYGKRCTPRSDSSYRSSLFLVHAVCLFLNSPVMLGNYLQQPTSAEDILRFIFLGTLRVKNNVGSLKPLNCLPYKNIVCFSRMIKCSLTIFVKHCRRRSNTSTLFDSI